MTTTTAINQKTDEEIFKEALEILIKNMETEADFLKLNDFLVKQTNYIPLMSPKRGSYNAVWDVKNMLKEFKVNDWTTFSDTDELISENLKESLEKYKQIEQFIETVNGVVKNKLNGMINDSKSTPKDIIIAMFEAENKSHAEIIEKVEHLETLTNAYETMSIIRAFRHIQETRGLTVKLNKLRGVLMDLKFAEDGTSHIEYKVMIKRGTPTAFGGYKIKLFRGTIESI